MEWIMALLITILRSMISRSRWSLRLPRIDTITPKPWSQCRATVPQFIRHASTNLYMYQEYNRGWHGRLTAPEPWWPSELDTPWVITVVCSTTLQRCQIAELFKFRNVMYRTSDTFLTTIFLILPLFDRRLFWVMWISHGDGRCRTKPSENSIYGS